jgi:hypothetical protein
MNASEERHTRGLVQQLAVARATIDALLSGQIAVSDATNRKGAEAELRITGGGRSPTKPRGSGALQSVAVAGTENVRRS